VSCSESQLSFQSLSEISTLKFQLAQPRPPRVLIISASDTTRSLLATLLGGFFITAISTVGEALDHYLPGAHLYDPPLDFIIIDAQVDSHAEDLANALQTSEHTALRAVNIVHLYTPTTEALASAPSRGKTLGVTRLTKPPRQARLLHALGRLKHIAGTPTTASYTSQGPVNGTGPRRTLFGNVLIAEGRSWLCEEMTYKLTPGRQRCCAEAAGKATREAATGRDRDEQWARGCRT
jgi:hypothetical protein